MPNDLEKSRLSDLEVDERAGEADAILSNPVFRAAMDEIHSRAVGILVASDVGSLTATQAHAMLRAVNELMTQLKQFRTDADMRKKYHSKGDKHAV